MFSDKIKRSNLESRIALLEGRQKDNGRIVAKLKRQLANLNKKENAAVGSETV